MYYRVYTYEIKHHRVQHMQDAVPHKQFIFVHKNRKDKKKVQDILRVSADSRGDVVKGTRSK